MMPRTLWWERYPERLEYELEALRNAEIDFTIDEQARAAGLMRLELRVDHDGATLPLVATFSYLYPYFRFEVVAPGLNLDHHQNPFEKNLCFIGRRTRNWRTSDTLAKFIKDRLPLVIRAATTSDRPTAESIEEHQGEPVAAYYSYRENSIVLIDSAWTVQAEIKRGNLVIGIAEGQVGNLVRGVIKEVRTCDGRVLAAADPEWTKLYSKTIQGRWYRVQAPALDRDTHRLLQNHSQEHPSLRQLQSQKLNGWDVDIIGLVYQSELTYGKQADDWIFAVRTMKREGGGNAKNENYLARAGRAGRTDLSARVPELISLAQRRIALVGLGGMGAPAAIELARAGVGEMRLLDQDIIEPGTIVRWPLGISSSGRTKAQALLDFIGSNYPYTKVSAFSYSIGRTHLSTQLPPPSQLRDADILDWLVDGVDLIYDATAELGIQYCLSDLAAEKGIPYMCVSTTPGAWGGIMARVRPGKTEGCWSCLQGHLNNSIPLPAQSATGRVQPVGCTDPTFTGAGCDVASIALAGVRLAIATLCVDTEGAYPDFEWDVGVCNLRTSNGQGIVPQWETFPLRKCSTCPKCQQH